jgi:hypothetical protein
MRLTWVSGCAMVHSGAEPGAGMTSIVANASGSTELAVVVTSHTLRLLPAMMNELADALVEQLPPRCTRVRLVAWNSGCLHDDRPAPAYQLASRLGVEVIAPAGPLLGVPGGSLFAPAGRGAQRPGGWWRFAQGSAPSRVGWRYPAPSWDADLGDAGELGHDLVVEQVPAGLWLHRSGYRSVTDLVYSVPVDPVDPALIVSHPAEVPLRADEVARALGVLPRRTLERLVFTPYGPRPVSDGRLGDVAASVVRAPVRVRAGLPLFTAGGKRALVTVDSAGRPCWRPFVRELRYHPHVPFAEAADWVNPAPGLLAAPVAHATFSLGSGWVAEVIEAGLWIRPAQPAESADQALPLAVDECTIMISTASAGCPPPPAAAISELLRNLPADARSRVRLAVHRGAGDDVMSLVTSLCAQLSGAGEVRMLGPATPRAAQTAVYQPTPYPSQAVRQPTAHPAMSAPVSPPPVSRPPVPRPPISRPPISRPPTSLPPAVPLPATPPVPTLAPSVPQPATYALEEPTPYPPQPAYQPTQDYGAAPLGSGYQPTAPSAYQPMPPPRQRTSQYPAGQHRTGEQPAARPAPHIVGRPTPYPQQTPHPVQQPEPAVYGTPKDPLEDSQPLPRAEIRSHRTAAGKPTRTGRQDDRATTSDLNRLLGFFDEIRQARAWDEEPAGSRPSAS